uniref:Uncharacterized protein n=1 Tax=Candidatus Kentrum sp. SD TaxID=2126332 RepID=A0A450YZW3_9GAMM|nr:MAG: hypothetical protein BECKSD772F_GA0070984_109810 [Candidatus Kentron sp. SD]VFK47074.1 MAG: hypothetical protein BECKSD772E_GA0070983_108711 [Candidatus Kentron sp. SD]
MVFDTLVVFLAKVIHDEQGAVEWYRRGRDLGAYISWSEEWLFDN